MESEQKATAQISYNSKKDICENNCDNNVKPWKQGKYRDFFLTLNCEIDEDKNKSKVELMKKYINLKKYLTSLKYQYILSSIELNKRDYYHIHIFIQFDTPHKLNIKKLEGCHINIINKTINKVLDYVRKDGCILDEYGYPRYITGNPSIKDISLSRFSEINENSNAKYYRVYKEIKKDNQGLYNTPKKIYIRSKLPKKGEAIFKDFNFLTIKDNKIKTFPINMILKDNQVNKNNIEIFLGDYNEPIQNKYYPSDIEQILFIIPNNITPENIKKIEEIEKYKTNTTEIDNEYDKGEEDEYDYNNDEEFIKEYNESFGRQSKYYYGENFVERPIEDI